MAKFIRAGSAVIAVVGMTALATDASADSWPMKQRDAAHTGRSDFVIPTSRMNGTFFDVFAWQRPTPSGAPVSASTMAFFDGVGPNGTDIVIVGYHWPKGVAGMNRRTGALFWSGNPVGGETIGVGTPAFSPDGRRIYIINDATERDATPRGAPLMAFDTVTGPGTFVHNGAWPDPWKMQMPNLTVGTDGTIYGFSWANRPAAARFSAGTLNEFWYASSGNHTCYSWPTIGRRGGVEQVVVTGRDGWIAAYNASDGVEAWRIWSGPYQSDANVTIDPTTGRIYAAMGGSDIVVAGLTASGNPLWSSVAMPVYDWIDGKNDPERAQSGGCLSHDGSVYYFQTVGQNANGHLYAIDTSNGSVKWSLATSSRAWESHCSSPVVTPNGVIVVGNNDSGQYLAIRDLGDSAEILDTLSVADGGSARSSAVIAADGLMYLPLRAHWIVASADTGVPDGLAHNLFCGFDLRDPASPDLTPSSGTLTGPAIGGQSIDVSFSVANVGAGTANGPWQDRVFISSVGPDDSGSPLGSTVASPETLAPGAFYPRNIPVTLPMAEGQHWISIRTDVDAPGTVNESNESNNRVVFAPINLVLPRPDLVAEDFSGFASARVGDSVPLAFTVFNRGIAPAVGSWKDRVYLSKDDVVGAGDVAVGTGFPRTGPLPIAAPYQVAATGVIPEVTPGAYKLLLALDDDKQLSEGPGESNNVRVLATDVTILPRPLPDLRVSNITPPSNATPGSVAEIAYTVTNIGEGVATGSWDETLYGSLDATIGGDIAGPTTRFSGPLLPGQSVQRRYNITVPNIPIGNYWLVVAIDTKNGGEIAESNETNNAGIVPVCFNCNTPNLVVSTVTAPPTGVSGSSIDVTWTVTNTGLGNTLASWIDRVTLRTSCNDPKPVVIAEFRRSSVLLGGASYTLTRSVTLPPEIEGDRYIAVTTDAYNELAEPGGEGDNTTCSPTVTAVSLTPGPDLTVTNVTPLSSSATFDGPVTLRWTVRNIGNQPATAPWNDRVFLSGNAVRDGDDFPLEPVRAATITLQPDGEYLAEQTVQLPLRASLTASNYYFIVVTDVGNVVAEQRESNQSAVSPVVHIDRPPLPDLRVVSISTPAAACPGSQVDVVYTIINAGTAPADGTWVERILASSDDSIGNDYFGSQLTAMGPLAPGEQVTRQGKLTVPNDGLSYRAVVSLDTAGSIFESDETNNGGLSQSRATVGRPDLQAVSITASPTSVLADADLRVTWGSRNNGLCATPSSFLDSVFLVSVDGTQSYLLGSGSHANTVMPGQTDPLDQSFPVPGRIEGEFRIQVRTDTASNILEPDEANNSALSSAVITVAQPARADLFIVPASINVPANGLVSSQGTVSYMVTNLGGADAQGPWIDRIVARRAGSNPGPDIEIGTYSFNGTLQWGQMFEVSVPVALPAEPGDYTVCVITDSGDRVNEGLDGGEDNNRECSLGTFNADGYRVVVTPSITDGQAGTPVTVTGYAEKLSNGQRVALDTPVRVRHTVRGFERILKLKADSNGAFGSPLPVRLELLPNEAGRYVITAGPPGAIAPTPEVIFTLHGLRATPTFSGLRVAPAYTPTTGTLELFNAGDVPLTNLLADISGAPPGLNIDLRLNGQPLDGKSISSQQTIRPSFQLSAPAGTAFFDGPVTINWKTDQGAMATTVLSVRIAPRDPALTADPGILVAGMVTSTDDKPVQSAVQFNIKNTGGLPTGQIRVEVPNGLPWLTLSSPANVPSLNPDEESRVVLTLAPTISQALGDFTGQLVLRFDNNTRSIAVPYRFTHRSDAVGSIEISTANEETYWAPGRPPLANAAVTVRDARTNQVMGTQTTGNSGKVRFDDLPEGAYYVEANRDQHRAYTGLAEANRSAVSNTTAFLSRQAVTYSWRVDPIQVEDRYRFVLDATFVTNVYKPVLDITVIDAQTGKISRVVDLDDVGFERLFYVRIENKGLVDAQNVRLTPTDAPTWQVELLTSQLGNVRPGATNAVTVPMVIRRMGQFARSAASGGDCQLPAMVSCFDLPCDKVYTTCDAIPFRWVNVCTGPGGYTPAGGNSSGPGGSSNTTFSNTPTFQCNTVCSCPDSEPTIQVITKCVGSDPVVLSAPCSSEMTWLVSGGPSEELGNCVPSLRLPSDKPRHYVVQAYCKCPEGSRLVGTYDVYFVKVTIRDEDDGKVLSPDVALKRWVGESISLLAEVEPSDVTIARTQWTVPNDAITAYDPTATSSNGPQYIWPLAKQRPRMSTIYFATRDTREVAVQLTLKLPHGAEYAACPTGVQIQVDAIPSSSFQFRMPHSTVKLVSRDTAGLCGDAIIGTNPAVEALMVLIDFSEPFCVPATSGLNYDWVEPSSPPGKARPLQVIESSNSRDVDYLGTITTDAFSKRRDAGFPFRDAPTIGRLYDAGDDPNMPLGKDMLTRSFSATMATWLLWKSERSNSIWIPVTSIGGWGWDMEAVRGSRGDPWVGTTLEPSTFGEYRPTGDRYGSFPEWNGVQ